MTDYEIRNTIKEVLIKCRKEKGISQKKLAEAINSKPTTIASWEQGDSLPKVHELYHLAKFYGKSIDYMYGEEK